MRLPLITQLSVDRGQNNIFNPFVVEKSVGVMAPTSSSTEDSVERLDQIRGSLLLAAVKHLGTLHVGLKSICVPDQEWASDAEVVGRRERMLAQLEQLEVALLFFIEESLRLARLDPTQLDKWLTRVQEKSDVPGVDFNTIATMVLRRAEQNKVTPSPVFRSATWMGVDAAVIRDLFPKIEGSIFEEWLPSQVLMRRYSSSRPLVFATKRAIEGKVDKESEKVEPSESEEDESELSDDSEVPELVPASNVDEKPKEPVPVEAQQALGVACSKGQVVNAIFAKEEAKSESSKDCTASKEEESVKVDVKVGVVLDKSEAATSAKKPEDLVSLLNKARHLTTIEMRRLSDLPVKEVSEVSAEVKVDEKKAEGQEDHGDPPEGPVYYDGTGDPGHPVHREWVKKITAGLEKDERIVNMVFRKGAPSFVAIGRMSPEEVDKFDQLKSKKANKKKSKSSKAQVSKESVVKDDKGVLKENGLDGPRAPNRGSVSQLAEFSPLNRDEQISLAKMTRELLARRRDNLDNLDGHAFGWRSDSALDSGAWRQGWTRESRIDGLSDRFGRLREDVRLREARGPWRTRSTWGPRRGRESVAVHLKRPFPADDVDLDYPGEGACCWR